MGRLTASTTEEHRTDAFTDDNEFGNILFTDLWAALDREKKLVSKMVRSISSGNGDPDPKA